MTSYRSSCLWSMFGSISVSSPTGKCIDANRSCRPTSQGDPESFPTRQFWASMGRFPVRPSIIESSSTLSRDGPSFCRRNRCMPMSWTLSILPMHLGLRQGASQHGAWSPPLDLIIFCYRCEIRSDSRLFGFVPACASY
ncbi:hypothetical protein BJX96DRAFT_63271 [Aspergillus floccosus]